MSLVPKVFLSLEGLNSLGSLAPSFIERQYAEPRGESMPLVGSHIVPWAGLSMCHYKAPRGPHLAVQLNDLFLLLFLFKKSGFPVSLHF